MATKNPEYCITDVRYRAWYDNPQKIWVAVVMIDQQQVLDHIIIPVLNHLSMDSTEARALVLGTGAAESAYKYIAQVGGGPALSPWQVEPATEQDNWKNYLDFRPELSRKVVDLMVPWHTDANQLAYNWAYAVAMCRIKYWRDPNSIPDTAGGLADYHKRVYNSSEGAANAAKNITHFKTALEVVRNV